LEPLEIRMKNTNLSLLAGILSEAHPAELPGGAAAVVLIHGAGGSRLSWPPQLRRLAGRRTLAVDLPGHGASPSLARPVSIPDYAAALVEWMDAIHLEQALLVGHSMGGAVALWLALEHPRRVLGLGLLGAAAALKVSPVLLAEAANPDSLPAAIERIIRWSFSPAAPARLKELTARRMAQVPSSVLYGDLLACDSFSVAQRLGEIRAPALVLSGSLDKMTPPEQARRLAEGLPSARLELLPGAGHMLMHEQPQAVAQHLGRFAAELA
jgi:pimeloyl-ACP methyl ester carboxylesterase